MDLLIAGTGFFYIIFSGALFIFGSNFIYFSIRAWRESKKPVQRPPTLKSWPRVTVQLPIFNEMYVAERVIEAAAKLDYPAHLLQIQVLDDSTDETVAIARRAVERVKAQGVDIEHLHRVNRSGYKAGALQAGLDTASGEFLAIFDADFVPPPDFLKQAIPYFDAADVAFVQTRWGHINKRYSWLTYLQSLAIDGHFMVEQFVRSRAGYWFNFNGTAGIWRREALDDAGGWTADTLTEDLDLSYRAYLRGWRGRYVRDIVVPSELPVSFKSYRRQQHRWARGSMECAIKLGPQVWRSDISLMKKIQATLHLSGYTVHLLLFGLTLIYPLVAIFTVQYVHLSTLYGLAYLFAFTSIAPTLFFIMGQQQLGRPWWRLLPKILAISVVGSGLMLNSVRAAWQILRKRENIFERTAKFGIEQERQKWTQKRYQLQFDSIVYPEFFLGFYSLYVAYMAATYQSWGIALYALMFGSGLVFVAGVTVHEGWVIYRDRRARAAQVQIEKEQALQAIGERGATEKPY